VQSEVGEAEDDVPSTAEEVKEEVGPVRRSTRLAVRAVVDGGQGRKTSTRKPRRVRQWVTRYLVKWKGFGEEEATWERVDNLRLHAQDAINEYEYRQAQERGEEVVGVHYMHKVDRKDGRVMFNSLVVGGTSPATKGVVGGQMSPSGH
jgi:hypothetical protein